MITQFLGRARPDPSPRRPSTPTAIRHDHSRRVHAHDDTGHRGPVLVGDDADHGAGQPEPVVRPDAVLSPA